MIVSSEKEYIGVLEKAYKLDLVAIDTETQEFHHKGNQNEKYHPFQLKLYGVGIYGKGLSAYIPEKFLDLQLQFIFDKVPIVFHNAKFDLTIFEEYGFNIKEMKIHDTMIMSLLLDENRRSHGLKSLAESVLKVDPSKITKFTDIIPRPTKESLGLFVNEYDKKIQEWEDQMGEYCIDDCKYTYKLYQNFWPKIVDEGLEPNYTKIEIPIMEVLRSMERRGIRIDLEYLVEIGDKMDIRLIEAQSTVWTEAGKEFAINSSKQLSEILFTEMKFTLPDEMRTPRGSLSTNSEALTYLAKKYGCKLASSVLTYRELYKLRSTYVEGLQKRHVNGIIHAQFKQHGAVTGRLSSANPNLQNIPRRDDEFDIRKAFIPREGYVFVISDLSQIELRLLAWFSKDPTLINAYINDKDIHQQTADALGCERSSAKAINFGLAYGRSAFGLSKQLEVTPEEAQKFIDKYFAQFPKLKVFFEQAKNTMKKDNEVRTIFKRKRRFPQYKEAKRNRDYSLMARIERQTVNSIIQGSAADLMKAQMKSIAEKIVEYDAHLLIQVHDEVLVEVPIANAEKVMEIVKHEMEHAVELPGVPLKTEPCIATRWQK